MMVKNTKFKTTSEITIAVIFFSVFAFSLFQPIGDPDTFWHLKTGEWIWQNKKLPDKDPFAFTTVSSQDKASPAEIFILRQYWFAQLVMYAFYRIAGFYGILAFRCLVYLGIGLVLYRWMRKGAIGRLTALIFLIPVVWFSALWIGTRPNILSFLFVLIVVYLLEDLRQSRTDQKNGRWADEAALSDYRVTMRRIVRYCALPIVMLSWARMHTGFIIGDAIILLYMTAEAVKVDKTKGFRHYISFFSVCLISIVLNAHLIIPTVSRAGEAYSFYAIMSEMMSPFALAKFGRYRYLLITGFTVFALLLSVRKLMLRQILVIIFVLYLSLNSIRFIPFLVFIAAMFIPNVWGRSADNIVNRFEKFYLPHVVILLFLTFFGYGKINNTIVKSPVIDPFYSNESVEFIKKRKPEKELFNYYSSGGYLIWSLYPEYRVFIDGRTISPDVFQNSYYTVLSGRNQEVNGIPVWKAILDAYKVNTVLVPALNIKGDLGFIRLVRRLVEDREWELVFIDKCQLLFVRTTPGNKKIIEKYSMPKILAYETALMQAEFYRSQSPKLWVAYTTLGEINVYLGRPEIAVQYFEYAFKLNPGLKSGALGKLVKGLNENQDIKKLVDQTFG